MKPIDKTSRIGVVGVGKMGANMARRLKDQGFEISALFDIQQALAQALAEELDSQAFASLREVTAHSDVIITVVSDDPAMRAIYEQAEDHLLMNAAGKLFLNCATITPAVHVGLHQKAQDAGALMLECPMASSITQAREGTLYLMCAGEPLTFEMAAPVLQTLAAQVIFTGPPGSAAQIKALVNLVMNINTAALAEGLGLADALGLDLNLVRQVFSQTGANSRVLETDGDDMQNREHEAYFTAAHAAKDSKIAWQLGRDCGLPMVLAEATHHQYEKMLQAGLGNLDKSGVSELTFLKRLPQEIQTVV